MLRRSRRILIFLQTHKNITLLSFVTFSVLVANPKNYFTRCPILLYIVQYNTVQYNSNNTSSVPLVWGVMGVRLFEYNGVANKHKLGFVVNMKRTQS